MNRHDLIKSINIKKSFLCIGLDTDVEKIPDCLKNSTNSIFEFNKAIIDSTHDITLSYKLNSAFYESAGIKGWQAMADTAAYIKQNYPDIFLIADAKRGDIGNTSKMYAKAFFETMNFDAITVAPYMGKDSVAPFLEFEDKWVILLALTSNSGAYDFQFLEHNNMKIFEHVLQVSQTWGNENNMMYVVGATKANLLTEIRKTAPNHFLLIPGVGAQGGSLEDTCIHGLVKDCGLLVNSSRNIIYAGNTENFAQLAREEALKMQRFMENVL